MANLLPVLQVQSFSCLWLLVRFDTTATAFRASLPCCVYVARAPLPSLAVWKRCFDSLQVEGLARESAKSAEELKARFRLTSVFVG